MLSSRSFLQIVVLRQNKMHGIYIIPRMFYFSFIRKKNKKKYEYIIIKTCYFFFFMKWVRLRNRVQRRDDMIHIIVHA